MIDPRLPAKERSKLMTFGDGTPPYIGYEWDDDGLFWKPGEGVADVNAATAGEDWLATKANVRAGAVNEVASIYLTLNPQGEIVAAYSSEARAQRDIDMVKKAGGVKLVLKTMDIEA